jgi:hypothetical protein
VRQLATWIEVIGIKMLVLLVGKVLEASKSSSDGSSDGNSDGNSDGSNESTGTRKRVFLVHILRCACGCEEEEVEESEQSFTSSLPGVSSSIANACRRNGNFVLLLSTLELDVAISGNEKESKQSQSSYQSILQQIILSTNTNTNTNNVAEHLYSFEVSKMLVLFEEKKYLSGILLLLSRLSMVYQATSINLNIVGRSDQHPH